MSARPMRQTPEWDPKRVGIPLVAVTAVLIAGVNLMPSVLTIFSKPALKVLEYGYGNGSSEDVKRSEPRLRTSPVRTVAWVQIAQTPPPGDDDFLKQGIRIVDSDGVVWPVKVSLTNQGFLVSVPEGYRKKPSVLYAEVTKGSTRTRVRLPELPEPPKLEKPALQPPWRGLSFSLRRIDGDRRSPVGVQVNAPMPKGHILVGDEIGSSATMDETFRPRMGIGEAVANQPLTIPLRLTYPNMTDEVYLSIREMAPEPRFRRVVISGYAPYSKYGQWWLPSDHRQIRLDRDAGFILTASDRMAFRPPKRARDAVSLFFNGLGPVHIDRVDVVSPSRLGQVPLRVAFPSLWSSKSSAVYSGGPMDLVLDVYYTVYKKVRETTTALKLDHRGTAKLFGMDGENFPTPGP